MFFDFKSVWKGSIYGVTNNIITWGGKLKTATLLFLFPPKNFGGIGELGVKNFGGIGELGVKNFGEIGELGVKNFGGIGELKCKYL